PYTVGGLASWTVEKLGGLAADPGGVSHPVLFWLLVTAGVGAVARRRLDLAALLVAPPATAFVLAAARTSPLAGRLALWLLPVLFVALAAGVAAAAQLAVTVGARGVHRLRHATLASSPAL